MANNAWQELLPANSDFTKDDLLAELIRRTAYVLGPLEDVQTIDMQTAEIIISAGNLFLYDGADTTTVHDGASVLVDQNGRRYKIQSELDIKSVLSIETAEPVSPTIGDAYLIGAAATGTDWAGNDDDIAVFTALGWSFIGPVVGKTIYVESASGFYHYTAAGAWASGVGSFTVGEGGITPVEDQFFAGLSVEDELDTPPVSPTDGQAFLVGTSPTGDFSGQNGKVAYRRDGAWVFRSPYDGARIYDKDRNGYLTYEGSTWSPDAEFSALEFITSHDFDAVPQDVVNVIDLSAYVQLEIWGSGFTGTGLRIRVSTDEGSTFDDGAGDYLVIGGGSATSAGIFFSDGADRVTLHNFNKAASTLFQSFSDAFVRDADEVNNAIRVFNAGAGDVTAGKFFIYGVRG